MERIGPVLAALLAQARCEGCQTPTEDTLCPACRQGAEDDALAEIRAEFEEMARLAAFNRQLPCCL